MELPGFGNSKEGGCVNCQEDGGEGRPLWCPMVEHDLGHGFTVQLQRDPSVSEEQADPEA